MNIYFACSITGGREFENAYQQIVAALEKEGHTIPTSHLVQSDVMDNERSITPQEVYERDTKWIEQCDALIAEVSVPSHGVGYEIGYALNIGKPVLCIHHQERRVSKMITGNADSALSVKSYASLEEAVTQAFLFLNSL